LFRRDGDRRVLESFLQHGNFVAISTAAEGGLPAFPYALRVLNRAGMFENAAWCRTIGKKLSSVFLCGNGKPYGIFRHRDRRVPHKTVEAQPENVEHIAGCENHFALLVFADFRCVVNASPVSVIQTSL